MRCLYRRLFFDEIFNCIAFDVMHSSMSMSQHVQNDPPWTCLRASRLLNTPGMTTFGLFFWIHLEQKKIILYLKLSGIMKGLEIMILSFVFWTNLDTEKNDAIFILS